MFPIESRKLSCSILQNFVCRNRYKLSFLLMMQCQPPIFCGTSTEQRLAGNSPQLVQSGSPFGRFLCTVRRHQRCPFYRISAEKQCQMERGPPSPSTAPKPARRATHGNAKRRPLGLQALVLAAPLSLPAPRGQKR